MKEYTKKICVIGDPAVGKTSLIRRFIEERFDDKYLSTLGIKPSKKSILLEEHILTFMVWDLAGQEEFRVSQNIGYKDSKGALLVCDITRKDTLSNLMKWRDALMMVAGNIPLILLVNKTDLEDQAQITKEDLDKLAEELNLHYFYTSAKTGVKVEYAFKMLGGLMLDYIPTSPTFTSPMMMELRSTATITNPNPLVVAEDQIVIKFCEVFGDLSLGMTVARKKFEDSGMDFRSPDADGIRQVIDSLYETILVFQGKETADAAKREFLAILNEAVPK